MTEKKWLCLKPGCDFDSSGEHHILCGYFEIIPKRMTVKSSKTTLKQQFEQAIRERDDARRLAKNMYEHLKYEHPQYLNIYEKVPEWLKLEEDDD